MTAPSRVLAPRSTVRFRPPHFGLGGAPLGRLPADVEGERAATNTVAAAYRAGLRFFDTAPWFGDGRAEARLGTALAGSPRAEFLVSTKVGGDLTADEVRRSLDASLGRLGTSFVDLVLVAEPGERALVEICPVLQELRSQGVIGAIGAESKDWRRLETFARDTEPDAVQLDGGYSLLDRTAAPLLDLCAERGISAIVAGALSSGALSSGGPVISGSGTAAPSVLEEIRARRIAAAGEPYGVSLPQLAVAFPSRHPAVTSVLVEAGSPAEIRADAALVRRPIPAQLWDDPDLTALLTGP
ncbi:D-threo-aldose 1-dehydrogenase [Kribbella amoyensis]|uniref:D-threo-aldose 1-dehydrogenase n=1 Tax=Kribbella amoyensis TaxID=996641 RepID=A0A561BW89_9ACTN|nr:aldo/keto reductase [Kribbella amoyensis]TWD83093.1 D-threo-aldose 1-dehydrogenase [Kribbella amoyensis]